MFLQQEYLIFSFPAGYLVVNLFLGGWVPYVPHFSLGRYHCCYCHSSLDDFTVKDLPLKNCSSVSQLTPGAVYPVPRIPPDRKRS